MAYAAQRGGIYFALPNVFWRTRFTDTMSNELKKIVSGLSNQTKLVLWVVLFPLLLAGIGALEYYLYAPPTDPASVSAQHEKLHHAQEVLARVQGDPMARLEIDGHLYGNPLATQRMQAIVESLQNPPALRLSWVARPAALLSMAAGLVAALMGALLMRKASADGKRALRAREDLLALFAAWSARLPTFLTTLLCTQMLAVAGLLVVRCVSTYGLLLYGNPSRGEAKLQIAMLAVAGAALVGGVLTLRALLRSLRTLAQQAPLRATGIAVSKEQAPGLWRYVADLARQTKATEPVNVVVGITDSFYVTNHDMVLQPSGHKLTGGTVYVPLTYLSLLRRSEIDAVLAHEMGHFAGDDTAYSVRFSPIYQRLVHSFDAVRNQDQRADWLSMPVTTFILFLLTRFDLAVKHWSREREFAADQAAARVAGHDAIARALIRMTAVDKTVQAVIGEVARRPDEAGNDLIAALIQAVQDRGLALPDFDKEVATQHPSDTHPPTLERLKAVGLPLSKDLAASALVSPDPAALQWVRSLFTDSKGLQFQLLEDFKGQSRERNEAVRAQLSAMASKAKDNVDVFEGPAMTRLFAALGLMVLGVCALIAAQARPSGMQGGSGSLLMGMLLCAGVLMGIAYWFWKRASVVVMQLRPDGILLPKHEQAIAWGSLDTYSATRVNRTLTLQFTVANGCPPIDLKDRNFRRVAYNKKSRKLVIAVSGVKGMKPLALHDLVNDYRRAFYAREQLQTREAQT